MTEIIRGELVYNETTKNANGGTELIARRMVEYLNKDLLKEFQIIHSRVRNFEPGLKRILVCHDLASDPEVSKLTDPEYRKNFDKIVFVSNWQMQIFNMSLGIPYNESIVIQNGIIPLKERATFYNYGEPIRLIYHTTPHRGLEILIPVFKYLAEIHEDITLDVFSSFNAYGWESRDEQYKELFNECKNHERINYHGFQSNDVVRSHLEQSHIFAYPSIWPETSCIAAIEALSAGLLVVHPNLAALPETTSNLTRQYQWSEDRNIHSNVFLNELHKAIFHVRNWQHSVPFVQHYTNSVYNFEKNIAHKWNTLFTSLLN